MFDFEIKIAQTPEEVRAAQRLRYEVFHIEARGEEPGQNTEEYDNDKFDSISKHLIVVDKSRNMVVGTYRLLFSTDIDHLGFHSEEIFDMHNIIKIDGALLELGRSCIHKEYRKAAVINLLWNAIGWQVNKHSIQYMFGCPRLDARSSQGINEAFALIKQKHYAGEEFRVHPLSKNTFHDLDESVVCDNVRKTFRRLSPLVKGYLNLGALVCGQPAVNTEFGSIVIFVLLPTGKIASPYRRHFLGNGSA